ncbi:TonB-dependent receptor [Compostibacter hankyongensis]|uniref:TonB-dependent receptor n=1 Tax=Compostibacter hankyongensis TaxID=1007089 RepID=A0ABP8FLE7_9BACT
MNPRLSSFCKDYLLIRIVTWLAVALLSANLSVQAQALHTVSGYIRDGASGESLAGATVLVRETGQGVTANNYGFYSLTLREGKYTLLYSFLGYAAEEREVDLGQSRQLNVELSTTTVRSQEVVVTDSRKDENVSTTEMGKTTLSVGEIKKLPALFGEVDVLKSIQLLPGVQSAGEGNAGLYIRGGSPDQNLILLDGAPVYNTGHLFGFFSIFNGDAIRNVSLIKGGMPANYGGRLSSVVDVSMKEGNNKTFHGEGGIGLVASRFSFEGPLKKDKSSFIISGRRTYVDMLVKPFVSKNSSFRGSGYYFYDLNAKVNYIFSDKDRVYLSGYFGRDAFKFVSREQTFSASIPWGNATGTLRWNHLFNNRLFANTSLLYNDYDFSFNAVQNGLKVGLKSGIRDVNGKIDFDYYPTPRHHLLFGANYIYHTFVPSTASGVSGDEVFNPENPLKKYAHEIGLYLLDDWEAGKRWKINLGLRYSGFQQIGPYTSYTRDAGGNKTDSTVYKRWEPVRTYGGLEPRIILRYALSDVSSLKAAVTRNYQYIHLVSNAGSTLPTDLWVPSTYRTRPQIAWQYDIGYFRNFNQNMYETSVELYYKSLRNQLEFREGYTPSLEDPENEFVKGKGEAYGAELYIHKQRGKLTGWIGYTLSWTWRQFPDLNEGRRYPAKYDRRHDLSVVATYALNKKWNLSAVFIYGTGNAITLPEKFYFIEGTLTQEYSEINAYRMKAYHRLDLSATYTPTPKPGRKFSHSWSFSLYNTYSRLNPYFLYFDQEGRALDGTLKVQGKEVALFPVIPAVTWNFKF